MTRSIVIWYIYEETAVIWNQCYEITMTSFGCKHSSKHILSADDMMSLTSYGKFFNIEILNVWTGMYSKLSRYIKMSHIALF